LVIGPGNHRRWEISLRPGEDPARVVEPEETWRLLARWITPEDGALVAPGRLSLSTPWSRPRLARRAAC